MFNDRRILAVVPARGGSKGIKLKNLLKINGKSLIQHVIDLVHECPFIDKAIVSTDHKLIKAEAEKFGLEVPFMRPKALSGDNVGDHPVLVHALLEMEKLNNCEFDIILMLQPTAPFRNLEQIKSCLHHLIINNHDSVWTVSETDSKSHPYKQLTIKNGKLEFFDERGKDVVTRQSLPPVYHRNGNCYAFTRECLVNKKTLHTENSSAIITKDFYVNIDHLEDVKMAEFHLSGKHDHEPRI